MTEETNHEPDWPEDLREGQELAECIRSDFYDLSMSDLEGIAGQYGININQSSLTFLSQQGIKVFSFFAESYR